MSPKTMFAKEDIVNAAFDIAKKDGFDAIITRNVAKSLGSSVAPIYFNFKNVEDLIDEVIKRVFAISDDLIAKQPGDNTFEKVGIASLEFARDYPVFFRELVLKPNRYMTSYETVEQSILKVMAEDEKLREWSIEEKRMLLLKMRVIQTGLSVMIANDHMPKWLTDQETKDLLISSGEELMEIVNFKRRQGLQ